MEHTSGLCEVPIWSLSDDLLSSIFAYLNANDRFRLAEVCSCWAGVSRMDWTDITSLDLSQIPKENIGPIIHLCPKLESITAQDCELIVKSVAENLRSELKSLHLYRVSVNMGVPAVPTNASNSRDETAWGGLCSSLPRMEELVLTDVRIVTAEASAVAPAFQFPGTLKRLQMSTLSFCSEFGSIAGTVAPWDSLDCLILDASVVRLGRLILRHWQIFRDTPLLSRLRQLRELCLILHPAGSLTLYHGAGADFVRDLNRLEVLCIDIGVYDANLSDLVPVFSHPALRILIITGEFAIAFEIRIPPRHRYPNGLESKPLPLLHVFVGGQITRKVRFTRSPNDAMEVHPITLPMPVFLELPEVAAIFKGSWIAEMIKRGAKSNSRLWDYNARIAQSVLFL